MTPPPAVTDEELAEVERRAVDLALIHVALGLGTAFWRRVVRPFVVREQAWKTLALALIATRGRGNAPEVLRAIEALEQMGERVPAVVRLP